MLHLITCHGRIMPHLAELLISLVFVVLSSVFLKPRHREYGDWPRNFGILFYGGYLMIPCCLTFFRNIYRFCFFQVVWKFMEQTFPLLIMWFRSTLIMGLSLARFGSLLKISGRN